MGLICERNLRVILSNLHFKTITLAIVGKLGWGAGGGEVGVGWDKGRSKGIG